jgi:CubicO group peptidase (beta-lactamase class C family)
MLKTLDAAAAGFDGSRLERLAEAIDQDITEEVYDGCVVIVARKAGPVLHRAFGFADRDAGRRMEKGSLFHSMSTGKQFTSALALRLVEQGDLRLTRPVREVIPEFAANGKGAVTLFQLLTHTSGIIAEIAPGITWETLGDLELTIKSICDTALIEHPGLRINYSAYAGSAIIAEMIRRIDGGRRPWRDVVRQDLFQPLGMTDSAVGLPDANRDRICPVRVRGKNVRSDVQQINDIMDETFEVPAGGCTLTAEDMNQFNAVFLNNGELAGHRFLSPAMIELIGQNHTIFKDSPLHERDRTVGKWPPVYGLGFVIRGDGVGPCPFGALASPHTFGGMGSGSAMFWVDRDRDMSMVFLSTGLIDDVRHYDRCQRYSDIAISACTSWPGLSPKTV